LNKKSLRVLEYYKIIDMLKSYCVSSLGKALAEKVVPMYEKNKIEKFQMETQEALQIRIKRGSPPIGEIYEMKSKVKRAEIGGVLSPKSLLEVSRNLSVARKLKGYLRHDSEDRESKYINIEKYISELVIDKKLEEEIDIAIISEEEISDLASSKLRSIRKGMLQKQDNIRQKLDSMVHSTHYDKYLQDALVTIRGDRYCLPVKQEHKKKIPGMIHDQSSSGATVFIEPMAVVQMNNELRELAIEEKKEIERILRAFTERVAEIGSGIISNQKNLRKLDLIFAKGRLAIEMNAFMPKFSDCGELNLKKARHPMIASKEVVANDIFLGKKFDTLVITGPNTGGKTVTLKTIGLLCMMAQSGLHIPTKEGSIVPIYREIFADIGDEQSIEQSLSTFSSHMTNIVEIFEKVKPGDLVLFDELGAGTDPTEGAALAMAMLTKLHKKSVYTVATTHYAELKMFALNTEGVQNASVEFNVETLSPSYKLIIGLPGKSNAFEISKRLGLSENLINSAQDFIGHRDNRFEDILSQLDKERKESNNKLLAAEEKYNEIMKRSQKLKEKEEKFINQKEKILSNAKKEARQIVNRNKSELDVIIKEIRSMHFNLSKEENKKLQDAQNKFNQAIDATSDGNELLKVKKTLKAIKDLKIGETVKVLRVGQEGTVLSKPNSDNQIQVQVGIMKMYVSTNEIERVKKSKNSNSGNASFVRQTKSLSMEIDVRGKSLDEAIVIIDKYIDNLYINGFTRANIIHGKGTGVLREGLTTFLKRHRHVKSHRFGVYGEGGDGVSIVELKE